MRAQIVAAVREALGCALRTATATPSTLAKNTQSAADREHIPIG